MGWVGVWVPHVILVSAQVLLVLTLDFGTSDLGLTITRTTQAIQSILPAPNPYFPHLTGRIVQSGAYFQKIQLEKKI